LNHQHRLDVRVNGVRIARFTVGEEFKGGETRQMSLDANHADDGLEVRFPAKAGLAAVGVTFVKRAVAVPSGIDPERWPTRSLNFRSDSEIDPGVHSVTIEGPFNAAGRGATANPTLFVCRPVSRQDEEPCARTILSALAHRAYRRLVTDQEIQSLLTLHRDARGRSGDFEAGIELALRAILVGPSFLFRIERDPANVATANAYHISDLELASRLSFFLWSSIPDDQLLEVAERGKLHEPAILEQQVRRMLADSRSTALVTNFAGQWLYLRNVRTVNPSNKGFPDFDDSLREAFQRETDLFMESQMRDDRSVVELLTANYTFLNEQLARHYDIPNVYGSHFRRVTFSDGRRGGLLGQASVLTVTSYPTRTSPTRRGKWMLENILGTPPPPPPPNVPALMENGAEGKPASVRERLEQHRKNPVCASCHARMDPLGFALENFDAIGKWRTVNNDDDVPIDSSGVFPDGTKLQGLADLRKALVNYREEFIRTFTERLLTYALGRGVESYDAPAIRAIMRQAASGDYRWSAIIRGVVASAPFQMRRPDQA
jgi:hypothetical protein